MPVGILGDIHGDFESVRRIMARHPDVRSWLAIGDLADDQGHYEAVDASVYWIKGNNENFDAIAAGKLPPSLRFLENGTLAEIDGLRVTGLGGTFAPTWYEVPASTLPHPVKRTVRATALADKRRHFVREEVNRCKAFEDVDVFLSHEAPRPYRVRGGTGPEAGKVADQRNHPGGAPAFPFLRPPSRVSPIESWPACVPSGSTSSRSPTVFSTDKP